MEKELEKIASEAGEDLEVVKKSYAERNGEEYLRESIKEGKFFDLLLSGNTVKTGSKVKYLDLLANNE
jgi:FKBP-type peptidyl-prolyl cis-trans isomerase (trigger factor)